MEWGHSSWRQYSQDFIKSVFSSHIEEDELLKWRWLEGKDGKQIFYALNNWIPKDNAIPRIFPGIWVLLIDFISYKGCPSF